MGRAQKSAQKHVVSVLKGWPEPHGGGVLTHSTTMKGIEVGENGNVNIVVKPSRAHCPCCLLDLVELRAALLKKKQIPAVHIEVIGVPDSHRWTNSINE